jgi:hypothetical protein
MNRLAAVDATPPRPEEPAGESGIGPAIPHCRPPDLNFLQSTYSELTDSPNAMRRIVSASSSATLSWRMRPAALGRGRQRDGVGHHQFIERELLMLSTAGPDSTGWVQ